MTVTELEVILTGRMDQLEATLAAGNAKIEGFANKANQTLQRSNSQMASNASALGRQLTMFVTLPILGIVAASEKMGLEFEASMAKVQGLAGVSGTAIERMKGQIMEMAESVGKLPTELSEAEYFIASAGLKGAAGMDALRYSAKASAAGLGDIKVVANVVTSAMNAYAKSHLTAAQATDTLVAAVREGKAAPDAWAGALGRILPLAADVNMSFGTLVGTLAMMTREGLSVDEAVTSLRQILATVEHPSKQVNKALGEMGLNAKDLGQAIAAHPVEALKALRDAAAKNGEAFDKAFPNIRAWIGALNLTGQSAETAKGILAETTGAVGSTDRAFSIASKTGAFQLKQALAAMANAGVKLSQDLAPVISDVAGDLKALADGFQSLSPEARTAAVAFALLVAAAGPAVMILGGVARASIVLRNLFATQAVATAAVTVTNEAATVSTKELTLADVAEAIAAQQAAGATIALGSAQSSEAIAAEGAAGANAMFGRSLNVVTGAETRAAAGAVSLIGRLGALIVTAAKAIGVLGVLAMAENTGGEFNGVHGAYADTQSGQFAKRLHDIASSKGDAAAYGEYQSEIARQRKAFEQEARNSREIYSKYGDRFIGTPDAKRDIAAYADQKMSQWKGNLGQIPFMQGLDEEYRSQHSLHDAMNAKNAVGNMVTSGSPSGGGGGGGGKGKRGASRDDGAAQQLDDLTKKMHEWAKAQQQAGDSSDYASLKAEILTGEYSKLSNATLAHALVMAKQQDAFEKSIESWKDYSDRVKEAREQIALHGVTDPVQVANIERQSKGLPKLTEAQAKEIRSSADTIAANQKIDETQSALKESAERLQSTWRELTDDNFKLGVQIAGSAKAWDSFTLAEQKSLLASDKANRDKQAAIDAEAQRTKDVIALQKARTEAYREWQEAHSRFSGNIGAKLDGAGGERQEGTYNRMLDENRGAMGEEANDASKTALTTGGNGLLAYMATIAIDTQKLREAAALFDKTHLGLDIANEMKEASKGTSALAESLGLAKTATDAEVQSALMAKLAIEGLTQAEAKSIIQSAHANQLRQQWKTLMQQMSDDMAKVIVSGLDQVYHHGFRGFFNNVVGGFDKMLAQMAQQWLQSQISRILFSSLSGVGGGSKSGVAGGVPMALSGIFGAIGGFGHRAIGGPVIAGVPYLVGENGPEIVVPGGGGSVRNAKDSKGLGGTTIHNWNIQSPDANSFMGFPSQSQVQNKIAQTVRIAKAKS